MTWQSVKIATTVPSQYADAVREAMAAAGAGVIGQYSHCSFSVDGRGRFLPTTGANPHIGEIGQLEVVEEQYVEMRCPLSQARAVVEALKAAHPYEEVMVDI